MNHKLRNTWRRLTGKTVAPPDESSIRPRPGQVIDVPPLNDTPRGTGRGPTRGDTTPHTVIPDTLVPGGILGPGGPAGIPTIPAVTMPPVRWTEPIPAGPRVIWRLRSDGGRLRRAARAGAGAEHYGDPLLEAGIAHLTGGLRSTLRHVLRSDPELLGADHYRRSWELELERRRADHSLALGRLQPVIRAAEGIAASTDDADEQCRWSAARNAEAELHDLQHRVREAELHLAEAVQYADVAGRRALERLDLVSQSGVERIELYRTAFNQDRTRRRGLDPLPVDFGGELIRDTVRPILDSGGPVGPVGPPDDDAGDLAGVA